MARPLGDGENSAGVVQAIPPTSGLAVPISASIETGALDNECLQGGRVDGVTLLEIDGTNTLAVQTRVEEPFRILQLSPLWKRQPDGVLEGLAYANDAVVGPDGHPLGAGGLLPLHLFDYAGVGALIRARSWPSLSPFQPVVFLMMASICWDADASFTPMLCCAGSAPRGPKGSAPCPFDACSQANNTAAAFPPAARTALAGCDGSWFLLSLARAPSRSTHCEQEG